MSDSTNRPAPREELDVLLREHIGEARARAAAAFDRCAGGRPLVLYGAGGAGRKVLAALRRHGIEPVCFTDLGLAGRGERLGGLDVLSPRAAATHYGSQSTFVMTVFNHRVALAALYRELEAMGCQNIMSLVPLAWHFPDDLLPYYAVDLPHHVLEEADSVRAAFRLLADEPSRQEYVEQVRWRLLADFFAFSPPCRQPQYFPDDLLRVRRDEVFVDCGAYDGDTIRSLHGCAREGYARILAFEPDPTSFVRLQTYVGSLPDRDGRITTYNVATGSQRERLRFAASGETSAKVTADGTIDVESVPLDEFLSGDPPTFIKMDIEGAELATLQGAKQTIARNRPVLAVCAYHRQGDLWQIPLAINAIARSYRFYLRRHEADCWELVLYAIPEERALNG
jgi:FkbM family methyltransferase